MQLIAKQSKTDSTNSKHSRDYIRVYEFNHRVSVIHLADVTPNSLGPPQIIQAKLMRFSPTQAPRSWLVAPVARSLELGVEVVSQPGPEIGVGTVATPSWTREPELGARAESIAQGCCLSSRRRGWAHSIPATVGGCLVAARWPRPLTVARGHSSPRTRLLAREEPGHCHHRAPVESGRSTAPGTALIERLGGT